LQMVQPNSLHDLQSVLCSCRGSSNTIIAASFNIRLYKLVTHIR
jgi:hypothetical protein